MPPAGASRPTAEHANPPSHSRISENDRAELEKLDAAVARMKKHTLPDPYIVTIAQDKHLQYQYQWRSQQYQWLHGTPFRHEEGEGIQYQTFGYQDPGSSMLSLHAQHFPEDRPGTGDSTRNATGSHTPAQGPKKVISFGAYKKKQTGETPTRDSQSVQDSDKSGKQPAVKGPAERVKALEAESADMIKAVEEEEKADASRDAQKTKESLRNEQASSKNLELKRKREGNHTATDKASEINGHVSPRPNKKARTEFSDPAPKDTKKLRSPSPTPDNRASNRKNADIDAHMPPKLSPLHDVPPKLSPLHDVPPKLSPLRDEPQTPDSFTLPPRISPDFPDNITATLKATDEKFIVGRDQSTRKEEGRSTGVNGTMTSKEKSSEQHSRSRARSKSPQRQANDQPSSSASTKSTAKAAHPPSDTQEPADGRKRNSLVAKIKFKKARKEDVQRILRLPARPGKHIASPPSTPASSDGEDTIELGSSQKLNTSKEADKQDAPRRSGKGVAQKVGPTAKKVEEKRPTAEKRPRAEPDTEPLETSEPPAKKKKVEDAVPESSLKKRQADGTASQTAPKKKPPNSLDLKKAPSTPVPPAVPSPAVSSAQKGQLVTPVGRKDHLHPKRDTSTESQRDTPSAQSSTPGDRNRTSQPNGTTSGHPSSNPSSTKAASSQAWDAERTRLERLGRDLKHAASALINNDKPSSTARRTAAAKAIESLFCYLVAFTCADRSALVSGRNITMGPWRSLPPFCSFVDRATHDFTALNGLASGLTLAIHARVLDIAARSGSEAPSQASMIELVGAMRKTAVNAEESLDIDALMTGFPKTWAGRSKTSLAAPSLADIGEPKKLLLQGGYRLPFGVQTEALQAARAGLAMLKEWVAREGLEYDFKLGVA